MAVEGDKMIPQGSSIAEVDRIRDIIMGPQMRLYEHQFKRMTNQLDILGTELEELRTRLDQQVAGLSSHCEQERSQIRAEARRVGASIYFADEAGIRSDHHTGTP